MTIKKFGDHPVLTLGLLAAPLALRRALSHSYSVSDWVCMHFSFTLFFVCLGNLLDVSARLGSFVRKEDVITGITENDCGSSKGAFGVRMRLLTNTP